LSWRRRRRRLVVPRTIRTNRGRTRTTYLWSHVHDHLAELFIIHREFAHNFQWDEIDVIKINLTIHFACAMNGMEPPMCVVTESWFCRFRFSTLDCEHRVNRSDITCWIYCTHISSRIYGDLKSLQTTTSFQPGRVLSLVYFFNFFLCFIPKVT
jgi:hypothetical protein